MKPFETMMTVLSVALLPLESVWPCVPVVREGMWRQGAERSLINEPEQKVVVLFDQGTEEMIVSPSFEGPPSEFGWLHVVPSRPKVEILEGALFHELKDLITPVTGGGPPGSAPGGAPASVRLLERKVVGAYDVSVLEADEPGALMRWLKANGYHMPPKLQVPARYYTRKRWTFVACRVKFPGAARGLRTGALAPIRLAFRAKQPLYPLRLSAANPKPFRLLLYLLLPTSEVGRDIATVKMTSWSAEGDKDPRVRATSRRAAVNPAARKALLGAPKYPTLSKLTYKELQVFVHSRYLKPGDCTRDLVWELPKRR